MDNSASVTEQSPGTSSLAIPVRLVQLSSGEEHVARLVGFRRFGLLRRWDDLLDEGVAAIFGITGGEAELLALYFHAGKFSPTTAATWLAERSFKPLFFVPNSGRLAAADSDAPLAAASRTGAALANSETVCRGSSCRPSPRNGREQWPLMTADLARAEAFLRQKRRHAMSQIPLQPLRLFV